MFFHMFTDQYLNFFPQQPSIQTLTLLLIGLLEMFNLRRLSQILDINVILSSDRKLTTEATLGRCCIPITPINISSNFVNIEIIS